jgi:hypothetical protein
MPQVPFINQMYKIVFLYHGVLFLFMQLRRLRNCRLREIDHCGDPGLDGRIILRLIFKKWDVELWTGLSWFKIGTGDGHL